MSVATIEALRLALLSAAVVMGLRISFHLVIAHAMVTRGITWKPNRYWHFHLVLAGLTIAAAIKWGMA